MDEVNVTIIGAGVVGLAVAAEAASRVDDIVVLERNDSFGRETSSRNSEVIHSGIYYPPGSLKTKLCIEGAQILYALCEKYALPYKKLGKLIVAAKQSELAALEKLYRTGIANGISGMRMLDNREAETFGSNFKAFAAIHLPSTGIIDSHSLMKHFAGHAQEKGATIAYNSTVSAIEPSGGKFLVTVEQENYTFASRVIVNCAGLYSDAVASMAGIDCEKNSYKLHYCKGSYFSHAKRYSMPLLIYPVPHQELTGLGVHATVDLGGRLRFGPDAEWVDTIDYAVNQAKRDEFHSCASHLFIGLDKEAFVADMAGIRPKLSGRGEGVRDFVIADETKNGLPGLINCIGIESPGLTSAPAIARIVADMIQEWLR